MMETIITWDMLAVAALILFLTHLLAFRFGRSWEAREWAETLRRGFRKRHPREVDRLDRVGNREEDSEWPPDINQKF